MGACECENPMEFGYELNSTIKEKETSQQYPKINYEKKMNFPEIKNNNNYNYYNNLNFVNTEQNLYEIKEISSNNNYNNNYINEAKKEGLNFMKEKIEINAESNDDNEINENIIFKTTPQRPKDDFSEYIFDNINKIREDPQSFIKVIEQSKKNIILDKKGIFIYKSIIKVALTRGLPAFDEAINFLKKLKPMSKLIFSNELMIESPINEEQIKDKKYMNEQINIKVQNGIPIKSFWRDIIKDPQTCLILMIVDDNGPNSGKKRNDILDPNMQCIGIVSKKIGKSFASYMTLC